jgi:biotin transport system substrate-specific component
MTGQALTIAGVFRPRAARSAVIYDLCLITAGSVLIALSAQLAFWMPFSAVPVTGQTFAVLMLGALFGTRRAGLCVLTYLVEGAAGLPVGAGGMSGTIWLLGPTGGYLAGFVIAAVLVGYLAQRGWDRKIWTTVIAMIAGNICIYAFGLLWLIVLMVTGRVQTVTSDLFKVAIYPFIAGDIIKIILAALLLPAGWKVLSLFNGAILRRRD